MQNPKKVIACDMDGTLTESKALLSAEMAEVLCQLLNRYFVAVVSGGAYHQFQKQFLTQLKCAEDVLKKLFLFPVNGSTCYKYENSAWVQVYNEPLSEEERKEIISALNDAIKETGIDLSGAYGEIIEDRGSQVTFSGKGQDAPIALKKTWDPDRTKRQAIVDIIKKRIPQFEIRVNATSSIDINKNGIDKAYAIEKIKEILNVTDDDIVFIGDALYKGGNDSAVKKTGVDFIQEPGPDETMEFLRQYI